MAPDLSSEMISRSSLPPKAEMRYPSRRVVKWIAKNAIIAEIKRLNFLGGQSCENCENEEVIFPI